MIDDEERGLPDHLGCKGVLIEEFIGVGLKQVRCIYCKKTLTTEELKKHGISDGHVGSDYEEVQKEDEENKYIW